MTSETSHAPAWAIQPEVEAAVKKVKRNKAKEYKTEAKQQEENERIEQEYEAKKEDAARKVVEKSALSLVAPISCIGVVADGKQFHFSTFEFTPEEELDLLQSGIFAFTFPDMKGMLQGFAWFCNTLCDDQTKFVGHNSWAFDFPRIRLPYKRFGIEMPPAFEKSNKHNMFDTMHMFEFFSGGYFKGLESVCSAFDIPFNKFMSGAEVPDATANKEFMRVTLYNMADVWACYKAFFKIL